MNKLRADEQLVAMGTGLVYLVPVELIEDKISLIEVYLLIMEILKKEFEINFMKIITKTGEYDGEEPLIYINDAVYEAFKDGFQLNEIESNIVQKSDFEIIFLNIYYLGLHAELKF